MADTGASTAIQSRQRPRRPTRPAPKAPIQVDAEPQPVLKQHDEAVVESPVVESSEDRASISSSELTPLRAHYLKKTLINLQFARELDDITTPSAMPDVSTLSYLGPPFLPPPKGAPPMDLPFLKYVFRQVILTFPFLAAAPKNFFPEKLQPFIASVLSRNLSPSSPFDDNADGTEQATRMKMLAKFEKHLALLLGTATKLVEPEEVVRLSQADLDRLEVLAKKRNAREQRIKDIFEINIVCIRAVVSKGRVRSRVHEEFIVRTRRSNQPDVFVARRYGDFKTLSDELRKMHPYEIIRTPPAKDKSAVTSTPTTGGWFSGSPRIASPANDSSDSLPSAPSQQSVSSFRLAREKNRLTLRAYLHSLMSSSTLASSPVLRSFLLSNPTQLSPDEVEDAKRREEADQKRDEGRLRFSQELASRVEGLRGAVNSVKGDIVAKDGLTRIFSTIKSTEDVRNLPTEYQAVLEWARVNLASTVFQNFVAADDASETLAGLKRMHGMMPYFMLKGVLRISNPVGMIRGVLDLFLAQPFGAQSLLQRMLSSTLQEEVKTLEEDIQAVEDKVDDPVMCEKVKLFLNAPRDIQEGYKNEAAMEKLSLMTVVLRSGEEPVLTRQQIQRISRAHRAHAAYIKHRETLADSDDDDGPQDDDAWLYEDLNILAKLYSRLRDREQLIALVFEGVTSELLKDIITIFYAPLAQVYKAASIADSINDLQNFVNDLIRTVEQAEEQTQEDPHHVVQMFVDLIHRHEQAFYSFVHKVHSKGEGLFDNLMRWMELFMTLSRDGLGEPISLEFILPHAGRERADILKEVDDVALYHYKLKVAYEDKIRRRFGKTERRTDADAEDEATQELVNSVVRDLSFGDLVQGDADELAAEDTDSEEDYSSDEETDSEDESEEESTGSERVAESSVSRSDTVGYPPSPSSTRVIRRSPSEGRLPVAPPPRARTKSFGQTSKPSSRHADAPPVPPLPKHHPLSPLSKPLPPTPSPGRSSLEKQSGERRRQQSPDNSHKRKDKRYPTLKQPELQYLPQLLPLFVEIMKPLLRPQET